MRIYIILILNVASKLGWITIEIEIAPNEPFAHPPSVDRKSLGRLVLVQKIARP